jgi:hypothetical protein
MSESQNPAPETPEETTPTEPVTSTTDYDDATQALILSQLDTVQTASFDPPPTPSEG